MVKWIAFLTMVFAFNATARCQDKIFSYIGETTDEGRIKQLGDSLKKPIFITGNKIYVIGSDCITRALDGNVNDRNDDGDANNRLGDGTENDRRNNGVTADRDRRGKKNGRKKNGSANDRDNDGDANDRDEDGDANNRSQDGGTALGARCSRTKSGKVLLYTRQDIKSKDAKIYFQHRFFSNKYFTIKQL